MRKQVFLKVVLAIALVASVVTAKAAPLYNLGILIGGESIEALTDDDEREAAQWFKDNYKDGIIYTPSTISGINTEAVKGLWVIADRNGLANGWQNLPEAFASATTVNALKNYLKEGGNLYLTGHATQLAVAVGRIAAKYAPNFFNSGDGASNPDAWGINAYIGIGVSPSYDRRGHQLFTSMQTANWEGHEYYPLIGDGWKEDHNCLWAFNDYADLNQVPTKLADFEVKTNSVVLGTWQQTTDCGFGGIIEFLPTADFKGRIVANGIGACEWKQNDRDNAFRSNIERMTKNCLKYLKYAPMGLGEANDLQKIMSLDMSIFVKRGTNYILDAASNKNVRITQATTPSNLTGARGEALRFDGYSTELQPVLNTELMKGHSVSFSIWVAPEAYPIMNIDQDYEAWTSIVGNLDRTNKKGWAFELSNRGYYRFTCYTDRKLTELYGTGKLPRYEWSKLVATVDAANCKVTFYRNGDMLGGAVISPEFDFGSTTVMVGKSLETVEAYGYNLNVFCGLIDDFDVYSGVLPTRTIRESSTVVPDMNYPASHYEDDIYRPHFHGMPTANWTNETHGAAFWNGKFHVYFQKSPTGNYLAHMTWGHISSKNLYKWSEEQIALYPEDWFDCKGCWSGCLFSHGDFNGGKPTIIYTGIDFGRVRICMADPADDNLVKWNKRGPVIDGVPAGMSDDFRDPYFFSKDGKDYIIVGTSKNGIGTTTLHRYDRGSNTWSNDGSMFFQGENARDNGVFWEMPNVTPLGNKWLFTTTPMGTDHGVRCLYWLGDIADNGTFIPTSGNIREPKTIDLSGTTRDGYGLLSPTFFTYEGKQLMLGIVPDKGGIDNYHEGWAHTYSLPREVRLSDDGNSIWQCAYTGLSGMRTAESFSKSAFTLDGTESLAPVAGRQIEIRAEFKAGRDEFGFKFLGDDETAAKLTFSPLKNKVTLDASKIERLVNDYNNFDGIYSSKIPEEVNEGDIVTLHLFVDNSIVDVFVNDKWAFSTRIYGSRKKATAVDVYADGPTRVNYVNAWNLDPDYDAATAVNGITINRQQGNGYSYNLAGQRVDSAYKGIVIKNGKKFLTK